MISEERLGLEHILSLKELSLDFSLKNISDPDELAILLTRYWGEKSEELHGVRFLLNKQLEIDDLKKVGSWNKKSGELLKKRARVLLSTLLLTLQPTPLDVLASILGYASKERYRDDYVKPLKGNQLIAYTIPEHANDPNQAYLITERGKSFLGGSTA